MSFDVSAALARLRAALDGLPADAISPPNATRLGATLVLLSERDGTIEAVYTRRREDLRSHPGQISFPGGRVDDGETVEEAAVREAVEEVGLDPSTVEILGRLPTFYIPPSRFWLCAVVAHWRRPHDLVPAEAEVAEVLHVPLARLADPDSWRTVRLSSRGWSWAWRLDGDHILWGATAVVTSVVLGMLDPDWTGGKTPQDLPDREVRPWEVRLAPTSGPARIPGVPEVASDALAWREQDHRPTPEEVTRAGALLADAVTRLDAPEPVLVLAGNGGNGDAARAAADRIAASRDVIVVDVDEFDGSLPEAGFVLDGLVGGGLRGELRPDLLSLLHELRLQHIPIVAVDLPSGVHPREGLVGETFTADLTIFVGPPWPGVFVPGLAPFVGDLYAPDGDGNLVRLVGAPASRTWAE